MSLSRKKQKPNLYLVGFMGVGKSALGRKAARSLGYRYLDSDQLIEEKAEDDSEIFESEGEAAFRAMERDFIDSGHSETGCVVSCGGGLVIQEGMAERLKTKGVVICLFASAESIIERTSRNQNRPLLNVENPEARIRELLAERQPIYMKAGICITTEHRSIPEIVAHMVRTYRTAAADFVKNAG